jgi:acyl transferase domain-containing protein
MGELYVSGARLDFAALQGGEQRARLALPTYPFQRQRYWVDTPKRRRAVDAHPLLGERHTSARGEVTFESELSTEEQPWLSDHHVFERLVAPGALHGALATAAFAELGGAGAVAVSQVQLHAPLILEAEAGRKLQVVLPASDDAGGVARSFEVYSRGMDEEAWTLHAAGRLAREATGSADNLALGDLQRRLARHEVANIYDAFADSGVRLGSAFRVVSSLWTSPGEALGELALAGVSSKGLMLHPTLLDGCFQVMAAALPAAAMEGMSYLPFGWERLWLAGPLPDRVWCYGQLREADAAQTETRLGDVVLCDREGRVVGGVDRFIWKRATREALLAGTQRFTDWLYEAVWRERPLGGGLLPAAFLQEPARLAASAPTVTDLLRTEGLELGTIDAFLLDLERLARSYVVQAFDALGWRRKAGEQVEIEALRQRLRVVSPHARLFARLLGLLAEAGVLVAAQSKDDTPCWRVVLGANDALPDAALSDPEALKTELLAHYPFGRIELELLGRCGAALCDVLRGRADPLALLFAEEGASAGDLYRMSPWARAYNSLVASIFAAMVADLPQGRRLRVLEIGAGTGGTTAAVLPALPAGRVDYVYTDVSAGFFAQAEARFGRDYPFVDYRALDIERDPESQGFAPHGYDVVLAANVLHATRDIAATLQHCRSLLAPDGVLVLLEGLRPQGWLDLTFGLLDGWWRFADAHRAGSALLPATGWRRALAESGFSSTAVVGAGESETGAQGVIIARGPSAVSEASGLWVIAADTGGVAAELAQALAARNQTVVIAEPGNGPVAAQGALPGAVRRVRLDPTSREAWQAQLASLSGDAPLRGVVHLCGLDGHGVDARAAELAEDVRRTGASALALTQALLDLDLRPAVGLSFLTRGAQVVERESGDALAGATLWGLGKTLALEAPQLKPRMLDLEPGATGLPEALIEELLHPDRETHIAYRGRRLATRLLHSTQATARLKLPQTRELRSDRSYLITGGLGGLGLAVAGWLADRGAGHVILNGRRPADAKAEAAIAALAARGVKVRVMLADVSRFEAVETMLAEIDRDLPPLAGVVHSVGVLADGALTNQSWERFETVLAPKVLGAWHLHRLTQQRDLDLFVLFSSTAGVLGNSGQANHAAANAFLDQLARHRRSLGLPGQSIAWGAWSGLGEAEEQRVRITAQLQAAGIGWIDPAQGLKALGRLLDQDVTTSTVLPVDWPVFAGRLPQVPALLEEVTRQASPGKIAAARSSASDLIRRLEAAKPDDRRALLATFIGQELQAILRLPAPPDPSVGFFDLGMDSLMAVEFKNRLGAILGEDYQMSNTIAFDHPNVRKLAQFLDETLVGRDVLYEDNPSCRQIVLESELRGPGT